MGEVSNEREIRDKYEKLKIKFSKVEDLKKDLERKVMTLESNQKDNDQRINDMFMEMDTVY